MPDRIEAGTYLVAGAITGGDLTVTGVRPDDMLPITEALKATGCRIQTTSDSIRVRRSGPIRPITLDTQPHPGFPTDMQAQLMALLSLAEGESVIHENIFENRFMHVPELVRMGADIQCANSCATIRGVESLAGASVMATDLRASASLVLAGLAAEGQTRVLRIYHLDRGYERLVEKLQSVGARVARAPEGRAELSGLALVSATG
jgi:UDP-N-acetylglucosamine 1-carboxyvinyltransferase